ncbi:MAG: ABC transporter permease [Bacillota bacterium]
MVRQEQTQGTLEISLFQAAQPWKVIVYQGFVGYAKTALLTSAAIVWGICLGGVFVVTAATVVSGLVVTLAAALAMLGFGLMAAGVVMVTKQGDPVTFTIETLNYLFTGLYYPLSVLPTWLQAVGKVFPLTHALDASRRVFLSGESLAAPGVSHSLAVLVAFAAVSIPAGIATFTWGFHRARKTGTLTFF